MKCHACEIEAAYEIRKIPLCSAHYIEALEHCADFNCNCDYLVTFLVGVSMDGNPLYCFDKDCTKRRSKALTHRFPEI